MALSNIFDVCQRVASQKLLLSMSLELALSRCRIYRGFLDCLIFSLRYCYAHFKETFHAEEDYI